MKNLYVQICFSLRFILAVCDDTDAIDVTFFGREAETLLAENKIDFLGRALQGSGSQTNYMKDMITSLDLLLRVRCMMFNSDKNFTVDAIQILDGREPFLQPQMSREHGTTSGSSKVKRKIDFGTNEGLGNDNDPVASGGVSMIGQSTQDNSEWEDLSPNNKSPSNTVEVIDHMEEDAYDSDLVGYSMEEATQSVNSALKENEMHTPVKRKKSTTTLPTCSSDDKLEIYDLTVDDDAELNIPIAALLTKGSKKKTNRNAAGTAAKVKSGIPTLTPDKMKVVEKQLPRGSPLRTIRPGAQPAHVETPATPCASLPKTSRSGRFLKEKVPY